jgi:hypothetical protein
MSDARNERQFPTEAEAVAFQEGVEMVNDSSIRDLQVEPRGVMWVVSWTDEDSYSYVEHGSIPTAQEEQLQRESDERAAFNDRLENMRDG